jgi:hypothetical protein
MNSNKQNSNNFLLGVSSNKNNSLQKVNNNGSYNKVQNNITTTNTYSNIYSPLETNTYSPLETKKIVFGIINKLEKDIVNLNNKINSLNKEKIELKNLSNKEIKTLKEVIKKLYMILSSYYKSNSLNLSKNDRIALLHKIKNTIEQNDSFMKITNKIIRNDKSFNNELNRTLRHNNMSLINESINKNNGLPNNGLSNNGLPNNGLPNNGLPNNVSLSNIIALKNSQSKEELKNNSRMNDNSFLKREEAINNGIQIPENIPSNNESNTNEQIINNPNGFEQVSNNSVQIINNPNNSEKVSNNSIQIINNQNGLEQVSTIKELSNNKNIYKSENKELTQSKKIPLTTKIEEHKINQERANQNFNEYKKFL